MKRLTKKQLRKLTGYKRVSKAKGARSAIRMLNYIDGNLDYTDADFLTCLFVWRKTKEGHDYWFKIQYFSK